MVQKDDNNNTPPNTFLQPINNTTIRDIDTIISPTYINNVIRSILITPDTPSTSSTSSTSDRPLIYTNSQPLPRNLIVTPFQ